MQERRARHAAQNEEWLLSRLTWKTRTEKQTRALN